MTARAGHKPLFVMGGGSKAFYGNYRPVTPQDGHCLLDMTPYRGIVSYHPSELVVTVRAGTPLAELEAALAEHGQMLAFEPRISPAATIGGCVAAGLSGPRRMSAGALRDFVLGAQLLDSDGRVLSFGGEVMKTWPATMCRGCWPVRMASSARSSKCRSRLCLGRWRS